MITNSTSYKNGSWLTNIHNTIPQHHHSGISLLRLILVDCHALQTREVNKNHKKFWRKNEAQPSVQLDDANPLKHLHRWKPNPLLSYRAICGMLFSPFSEGSKEADAINPGIFKSLSKKDKVWSPPFFILFPPYLTMLGELTMLQEQCDPLHGWALAAIRHREMRDPQEKPLNSIRGIRGQHWGHPVKHKSKAGLCR